MMAGPRIGRPDVLAAGPAAGPFARPMANYPRGMTKAHNVAIATSVTAGEAAVDAVVTRAHEIQDSLAHLTRLVGSVRRRLGRTDLDRHARLDRLHDRAIECWYELGRLAGEAQAAGREGEPR